jgi:hypothetical protein
MSLSVTGYCLKFTDDLMIAGWELFYTNLGGAEPRLVAAAVSADWSVKRS